MDGFKKMILSFFGDGEQKNQRATIKNFHGVPYQTKLLKLEFLERKPLKWLTGIGFRKLFRCFPMPGMGSSSPCGAIKFQERLAF